MLQGQPTATGLNVTEQNAMRSTAVWNCVRILSETVATQPLNIYHALIPRGKELAQNHSLYPILHDQANDEMPSYTWRETMMGHLATWGNGYSEIEFNGAGHPAGLWPLRPDRMMVMRRSPLGGETYVDYGTGPLLYIYQMPNGERVILPAERVLHIPGLGFNGIIGYSPITMCREAIGLAMATEEFGEKFFGNGAKPGGAFKHPGTLGDKAYERLQKDLHERHEGLSNAERTMILEEGMEYQAIGIPPEDAQFLATREFQLAEIARIFNIPPHMIADLSRSTNNNIEHQGIEFVQYTMKPWFTRWEAYLRMKLLTPAEQKKFFIKFLVTGLLQGDFQSRQSGYATGRQNGWYSANDIREMEDLNPIPSEEGGDAYLVNGNMIPATLAGQQPQPKGGDKGNG
jgi:HK97 family phage portal protein